MQLAIVVFVLTVLAIVTVSSDDKDEVNQLIKACMEQTGSTAEDLQMLVARQIPQGRAGLCFAACVGKGIHLISDNKLNMAHIRNGGVDSTLMMSIEACADTTDADECEAVRKIMECLKQFN